MTERTYLAVLFTIRKLERSWVGAGKRTVE